MCVILKEKRNPVWSEDEKRLIKVVFFIPGACFSHSFSSLINATLDLSDLNSLFFFGLFFLNRNKEKGIMKQRERGGISESVLSMVGVS
jgi:hypothetical protein